MSKDKKTNGKISVSRPRNIVVEDKNLDAAGKKYRDIRDKDSTFCSRDSKMF